MKEKIVITVTNDLSYDQRMIKTANTLVDLGYEVELIGRLRHNSIALTDKKFNQIRLICLFEKGKLFYIEYNLKLFFYLKRIKYHRIIAVDLDTIIPAYYASKHKNVLKYYDAHEYFPEMPEVVRRPLIKKIWTFIERKFVPKFDYHYTVSKGLKNIFEALYDKPFALIRNLPKQIHTEPHHSSKKFILYQGALNEGRGLEALLLAIKNLPFVHLKLAGEGDLSNTLRKLTKDYKIEDRVEFLGYLPPPLLKEITSKAYIGVNLLENRGLNYYHSLANKFFDYIQHQIPSINMDFPEYRAIQETYHCTYLIENLEIETIKRAIGDLYEDPKLYQNLQDNCLKARVHLNWENESEIFKTTLNF